MERVAGIEPAPSAWKAEVLPLNHTRRLLFDDYHYQVKNQSLTRGFRSGGGGWIRTTEARASDLQSDPFGHSGTPPSSKNISIRMELAKGIEPSTG
jgi:hypothetical protein